MLRLLLQNNAKNLACRKAFPKSLFNSNKALFSNSLLDEGEYIDGDFDSNLLSQQTQTQSKINREDFSKKFVNLENFGHNLTRQTPKPTLSYQEQIEKSVANLKSKFRFELDSQDEFAKQLSERKPLKQKVSEPVEPRKVHETQKQFNAAVSEALEKVKRNPQEIADKHLEKINFIAKAGDAEQFDPLIIYGSKVVDELGENERKTGQQIENYLKGEEGIDFISPARHPAKYFENLQKEALADVFALRDALPRSQINHDRLNEWRIRNEVSANASLIIQEEDPIPYPGSSKGPLPTDDPEFFLEWFKTHMPESHRNYYDEVMDDARESRSKLTTTSLVNHSIANSLDCDVANSEIPFSNPMEDALRQKTDKLSFHSYIDTENNEISPFVEDVTKDYQRIQGDVEKWAFFRIYPLINNYFDNFSKMIAIVQAGQVPYQKTPVLPTLYRYYNLLPEFARTNPIVINIARGLEFSKHDMSLKDKELALNYACTFALPMEKDLEEACEQAIISRKYIVPLWEELVVMDEDRDYHQEESNIPGEKKKRTPGPVPILEEFMIGDESKRPEHLKNVGDWPRPPILDPYVPEEDPFPVLPLEYYDNDDGFWDDYIAAKEESYNELPMIVKRPNFKH